MNSACDRADLPLILLSYHSLDSDLGTAVISHSPIQSDTLTSRPL